MTETEPENILYHSGKTAPISLIGQSKSEEGALTTWFYKCSNRLTYDIKSESAPQGLISINIVITGAVVHIGLAMDVFVQDNAPTQLKAHEDGHARICRIIYQQADKAAKTAAESVVGKTFFGNGSSRKLALENALQTASEAICLLYRNRTVEVANKVSATYDELTAHGHRKMKIEDALYEAFALNDEELIVKSTQAN